MKTRLLLATGWMLSIVITLALLLPTGNAARPLADDPVADGGAPDAWEPIAVGVDYQEYYLTDPNMVYVARMHRSVISVTLETGIGSGYLMDDSRETTSAMAARVDQSIGWWGQGWGQRSEVAAAVNGFYFDFDTSEIYGGLANSGWYAKRFDDLGGDSGFGWNVNRQAFIGECIFHPPEKQILSEGAAQIAYFDNVNTARDDNELILYTPQYNLTTGTADDPNAVEILVEMIRPTLILPWQSKALGVVREIRDGQGNTPIPFDHIVLSAHGVERANLLAYLQVGDEIGVSQEMRDYETDCATPFPSGETFWTKTYAGIGGDYHFLRDGEVGDLDKDGAQYRNPRTAIAFNDDYLYLIVVDGRNQPYSRGMTIAELALFARDTLGATDAITLDGGGSSTMVVNGEVQNNTYCNNVYCYHTFLPSVVNGNDPGDDQTIELPIQPPQPPRNPLENPPEQASYQRAVANSLMIVSVEPAIYSTATFTTAQSIITAADVQLSLGPGSNYGTHGGVYAGTQGTIVAHNLNGVLAKGEFWWKVDFGSGLVGWVPESALQP